MVFYVIELKSRMRNRTQGHGAVGVNPSLVPMGNDQTHWWIYFELIKDIMRSLYISIFYEIYFRYFLNFFNYLVLNSIF